MESLTYLKDIKETPKKLRLYLNLIKKMSPAEALDYLMYAPHKQGKIYFKALHSAISNATNTLKVSPDVLKFKLFTIEEGHVIKRYQSGSRGTVKPIKRRFSHIKIILVENPKAKVQKKIQEPKKAGKKAETKAKTPRAKKLEVKKIK